MDGWISLLGRHLPVYTDLQAHNNVPKHQGWIQLGEKCRPAVPKQCGSQLLWVTTRVRKKKLILFYYKKENRPTCISKDVKVLTVLLRNV